MRYATLLVLSALGCAHSTAPYVPPSTRFARHLDSLAAQACPSVLQFGERCAALRYAEAAPAAGVSPSRLTVETADGPETWMGSVFDSATVDGLGRALSTTYVVVAYSDSDLSSVYLAEVVRSGSDSLTFYGAFLLIGDSLNAPDSNGSTPALDISNASLVGLCHFVPGLVYADSVYPGCYRARLHFAITSTFAAGFGIPAAFQTFSIAPATMATVQVVSVKMPQNVSVPLAARRRPRIGSKEG